MSKLTESTPQSYKKVTIEFTVVGQTLSTKSKHVKDLRDSLRAAGITDVAKIGQSLADILSISESPFVK